MYNDEKLGTLLPTRTGTPTGTSNERQMLDRLDGSSGFRTIMRTEPDGSVTMCRTRNGHPHFSNTGGVNGKQNLWRGLAAHAVGFGPEGEYFWSPSVVFCVDTPAQPYKIATKDPVQLRGAEFLYWVGPGACICGNAGNIAYFGKTGANNLYTSYSTHAVPATVTKLPEGAPQPAIGLIPTMTAFKKSFVGSNALTDLDGVATFSLAPKTVLFPQNSESKFATQLPQVISAKGDEVVLHAKDEKYFSEPYAGYYTSEKCYWYMRLKLSGSSWQIDAEELLVRVRAVEYLRDVTGDEATGGNLPVTDDIERMTWTQVWSLATSPRYQALTRYADGAAYFTIEIMSRVDDEVRNEQTLNSQRRDYRDWPMSVVLDSTKTIGFVNGESSLEPVQILVNAGYFRRIFGEGQRYGATRNPWPCWEDHGFYTGDYGDARSEIGNLTSVYARKKVETSDSNNSYVAVMVGAKVLKTFEVVASCSGNAMVKDRVNTNRTDTHNWLPWGNDVHRSPIISFTGFQPAPGYAWDSPQVENDPYPSTARGTYTTDGAGVSTGFYPETEYASLAARMNGQPTLNSFYSSAASPPTVQYAETDYVTDLQQRATSRFIVGCDMQIGLLAYVEMIVEYSVTVTGEASAFWLYPKKKKFDHTVTCNFVIEYKTSRVARQLFQVTVQKPLYLCENEHTNWYLWPDPQNDPGMSLCTNPMLLPTPGTFKGIDNVFMHQGVCPDFAGFTIAESFDIEGCGYPSGSDLNRVIYAKRFKLTDDNMDWLLTTTKIDEGERGAQESARFFYSPELKKAVMEDIYEVEFDQVGMVFWVSNIPATGTKEVAEPPKRDASCWRI